MLSSDWSSDVCSSDLPRGHTPHRPPVTGQSRRIPAGPEKNQGIPTMKATRCLWQKAIAVCALGVLGACSVLPEAQIRDSYRLPVSSFPAPSGQSVPVDRSEEHTSELQ